MDQSINLSISAREDGTLEAAYIKVAAGDVAHTEELVDSVLLVDFDADDNVLGVEILAPVNIATVHEVAGKLKTTRQQHSFNQFVDRYAPRSLVTN